MKEESVRLEKTLLDTNLDEEKKEFNKERLEIIQEEMLSLEKETLEAEKSHKKLSDLLGLIDSQYSKFIDFSTESMTKSIVPFTDEKGEVKVSEILKPPPPIVDL